MNSVGIWRKRRLAGKSCRRLGCLAFCGSDRAETSTKSELVLEIGRSTLNPPISNASSSGSLSAAPPRGGRLEKISV